MMLTDLAAACRASGLVVREVQGWRGFSRPGTFQPRGILVHHTGGAGEGLHYAEWLAKQGRSDLAPPLCQVGLGRDGTVYVIAAGRANHAGAVRGAGSIPATSNGNAYYLGIEAFNTGSEGWSRKQYDAFARLVATLIKWYGWSVNDVRGHKETSTTGKIDPTFDMDKFRSDVKSMLRERPAYVVGFANLAFQLGNDKAFLSYLAQNADVLTLVEAIRKDGTPAPVSNVLKPLGWNVAHDRANAARAGSAVAWKAGMFKNRKARRRLIAKAVPGAKGMRNRFATVVPLAPKGTREWIRFAAAHASPARHADKNRQLERKQLRKIRRARRVVTNARGVVQKKLLAPIAFGIDANEPIDTIAKRLHLKAVGKGIVGILVAPKRIEIVDFRVDMEPVRRGWTDHPVIFATIKRKRK